MSEEKKSVYMAGAEDGLIMGPLMIVTVAAFGVSTYKPWMSLPALLLALAVPVLAYYRLGRNFKATPSLSFSALWLEGICMFFFGGLMMALATYALIRWAAPGFMVHQIDTIIEIYGSMNDPQAKELVSTFSKLKSSGLLPTPFDIALELLYFAVFSGSILSVIYALIIRRNRRATPPPPPFIQNQN